MTTLNPSCRIDSLNTFYDFRATVDVLRLDLIHPVISGNKWFKLQVFLQEACDQQKTILTFGGAFSNHIVATAAAASGAGLQSIGIIRGEKAPVLSPTLEQAAGYGMKLYFTSREMYSQKRIPEEVLNENNNNDFYIIPEGGYGSKGVEGAKSILLENKTGGYTHIITAVGTGTTLAGLTDAATKDQKLVGVSVLKNNMTLKEEIRHLLPPEKHQRFELLHDFHFGGYAKKSLALFGFMNDLYRATGLKTDFVYTGKAFYAAFQLLQQGYFSDGDKLLLVHTGGLQGNRSLPKGTLIFD